MGRFYGVRRADGKWFLIPISATLGPSWVEKPCHISTRKRNAERIARLVSLQPPLYLQAEAVCIEGDS